MSRKRFRGAVPLALLASFAAGVLIDGWLRTHGPPKPTQPPTGDAFIAAPPSVTAPAVVPLAKAPSAATPPAAVAMTGDIPHGRLRMPIDGATIDALKGGFAERRNGTRPH